MQKPTHNVIALPLAFLCVYVSCSAASGQDTPDLPRGVHYQRLLHAADEPANWIMYSGQYNGQRFSRLTDLNDKNVKDLRVKWVRQFATTAFIETTPLVVDGIMYATYSPGDVIALDTRTGLDLWTHVRRLPDQLRLCCGKVNRGVAILNDTLYLGTLDAKLVALDRKTGSIVWETQVADNKSGYSITSAPLIVNDMVITGIAGGDLGIRGFLAAVDATTGEERWRTYTIPAPGEKGHETWSGNSWEKGGSATWVTGSFDPDLNLIYWGVGNPGPDLIGDVRIGDNLYSDCVLALDADTGKIKWHFQFTPHDTCDWDACSVPVLADLVFRGRPRKLMLFANRNAFFYILDRETGEFLLAKEFAKQNWAKGIDRKGRPIRYPDKQPSKEGTFIYPDVGGPANWWPPSFSPDAELFYQMAFDGGTKYFLGEISEDHKPGMPFFGGFTDRYNEGEKHVDPSFVSAVRAIDPLTGDLRWEYRVHAKSTSGLLSTQGNLVFGGSARRKFLRAERRHR